MAVSIKVTQETGNVPPEKFWLGFLVTHKENRVEGAVTRISAVEIASLGLNPTEGGRANGGFLFPLDLRNANRSNKQIATKHYVSIDDLDLAFNEFKFIQAVDFFLGVKGPGTLEQLTGNAAITFISDGAETVFPVHEEQKLSVGIVKSFAKPAGTRLIFDLDGDWRPAEAYRGDMAAYCAVREQSLNKRPGNTPPVTGGGTPATSPPQGPPPPPAPSAASTPPQAPVAPWPAKGSTLWRNVAIALVGVGIGFALLYRSKAPVQAPPVATEAPSKSEPPVALGKNTPSAPTPAPAPAVTETAPAAGEQAAPPPQSSAPAIAMPPGYPTDIPPVPPGKTVVARDQIYKFGFPEHLAKTTQVIKAMRDRDQASFVEAHDWLKANRQSVDFDQATALDRRKFNEAAEQKIVLARANKDTASLRESAIALDTFLQQNFGAATAHLNLAIVRVLLDEPQAALPAAFHTIVFNPEGANGWVLLGAALAANKDVAGGAGAFCAALNIAKYSPKTIGLFTRIEAGDEYMSGGAKEAVQRTHAMCPGAGW